MILILVMAFFMLGCRFSCNGMKEHFAWVGGECNKTNVEACENSTECQSSEAVAVCGRQKYRQMRR